MFSNDKNYKDISDIFIKLLIKRIKENFEELSHSVWVRCRNEFMSLPKGEPRRDEILKKVNSIQKEIKKGCPTVIKTILNF